MGVIMLLGSKVFYKQGPPWRHMCTGSGAGPVDASQASTHIADPPHSAVGVGCDPSEG